MLRPVAAGHAWTTMSFAFLKLFGGKVCPIPGATRCVMRVDLQFLQAFLDVVGRQLLRISPPE